MKVINVYSRSEHELGRLLSNSAHTPFEYENVLYASVEAFWYVWRLGSRISEQERTTLSLLYGYNAKRYGRALIRKYGCGSPPDKETLKAVYKAKLEANPRVRDMLLEYDGGFTHYYVFGEEKIPSKHLWTAKLWEEIRDELRESYKRS